MADHISFFIFILYNQLVWYLPIKDNKIKSFSQVKFSLDQCLHEKLFLGQMSEHHGIISSTVRHEDKHLISGVKIKIIGRVCDDIARYWSTGILTQVQVPTTQHNTIIIILYHTGHHLYSPIDSMPWFLRAVTNKSS